MKDKGHFYISYIKSIIRIGAGAILCFHSSSSEVIAFGILFMFAELFGMAEEIFDKRG